MEFLVQNIMVGVVVGAIYGLIALGFVLIYKSTGILNLAQGSLVTIGAFICYAFATCLRFPFLLAVVGAVCAAFFIGIVIDRLLFRPMIGQPPFSLAMMTIALMLIIEGVVMSVWGADYYKYPRIFSDQPMTLGPFVLSYELFSGFIVSGSLALVFVLFFRFSRVGTKMRAVADDQQAAQAAGIKVRRIFMLSWGIGSVIAILGGISLAMITMVSFGLSFSGLKVLPVVILGGMESIPGALIGGLLIGIMESLTGGYIDPYVKGSKEILPFVMLIIFLLIKPYGLFGLRRIKRI
jgi:branched-chain amino acid transport system permease protein